jgi:hypothetical protein
LCNSLDNTNSPQKSRIVTYLGNHNKRYVKSHYLLEKCRQEIIYYRIKEKKNPIKIELKKNWVLDQSRYIPAKIGCNWPNE